MDLTALGSFFEQAGVRFAYLFGSQADGRATPASDCDIAVLMPEPWDAKLALTRGASMEQELRPLCGRPVDLVFLNGASPLLLFEAIRRSQVLYSCDEDERIFMEMRARDAYEEFVHIQSFYVQALKERLAS